MLPATCTMELKFTSYLLIQLISILIEIDNNYILNSIIPGDLLSYKVIDMMTALA